MRCDADRARTLHLPEDLRPFVAGLLDGLGLDRSIERAHAEVPSGSSTQMRVTQYPHAQVSRADLMSTGADFESRLDDWLRDADARGGQLEQIFVNLAEPWVGRALGALRERGFFCCGLAPRWLDEDALLLERLREPPAFSAIQVYSDRAKYLLERVQDHWSQRIGP